MFFFLNVALWKQRKYIYVRLCMPEVLWFFYFCFYCLRKTLWFVYFYVVIFIRLVLWCLNFEQVNFWILINLMNKTVVLVICAKCSKLITLEQNITSAQQLLLCLILFFVFSSEVLESGCSISLNIRNFFREVFFLISSLESSISRNIGIFLILELERFVSWSRRTFFGVGFSNFFKLGPKSFIRVNPPLPR